MTTFLRNILQLILSPGAAWSDASVVSSSPRVLAQQCMYPMFVLAALSAIIPLAYDPALTFTAALVTAAAVFVSLFATYVLWNLVSHYFITDFIQGDPDYDNCNIVVIYALSLLALAEIICNISPFDFGLSYFLPLGVALVVWKSNKFLHIKEDMDLSFIGFVLITLIIPPALIQQLFAWAMTN